MIRSTSSDMSGDSVFISRSINQQSRNGERRLSLSTSPPKIKILYQIRNFEL
jgi:hypothetical protein